ncbi:MAG: ABC transporter transmembrane domain-containing protein, partial [Sedimenticolaceae bacterium]|nr:ABC transporter transmembrane domain-containing protein [Sedimenticolaceae bacterium]
MSKVHNRPYSWNQLMTMILSHRRELLMANLIAVLGALTAVPVPLLIPLLVDEVLLQKPGSAVTFMNTLFPESWHGPILYITAITLLTLFLRLLTLIFGVWQTREFTCIAKDVIFRIRRSLLQRLGRISMSEYETLGSGKVASHLVTDLQSIDDFISISISKFVVAVLSILGTAAVL